MKRLERQARATNASVEAVSAVDVGTATRSHDNSALLATLPDLEIPVAGIVADVHADPDDHTWGLQQP